MLLFGIFKFSYTIVGRLNPVFMGGFDLNFGRNCETELFYFVVFISKPASCPNFMCASDKYTAEKTSPVEFNATVFV